MEHQHLMKLCFIAGMVNKGNYKDLRDFCVSNGFTVMPLDEFIEITGAQTAPEEYSAQLQTVALEKLPEPCGVCGGGKVR